MPIQDSFLYRQIDEYQIVKLLGRGGMARVYHAVDVRLKRKVAIKVIDKSHRSKSDYIKRFKQEAQAIARLEHPHVVRLYRYGELDDLVYMAMQYIEGLDLAALLQSYRTDGEYIELKEVTRLIREICQGFDYAHEQGVIHRDVKPSNIMINREGHAVLTDFGLAMLAEVTTQGHVLGSPHYLSPEQAISSANVVPQSDLYSVGVILYEMLTGEVPFDAEEPLDVAQMHIKEPVPLPSTFRPEISREVERVILKCLDKNPGNRYQTGAELARALEKAVEGTDSDTAKSIPTRLTIPERVNLQEALPALPPIPAAVASPAERPNESLPPVEETAFSNMRQTKWFPLAMGAGAVIFSLFLCISLIVGGVWAASRTGEDNPLTATTSFTSTGGVPTRALGSLASPTASPPPTAVPSIIKQTSTPTTPESTVTLALNPTPNLETAPLSSFFKLLIATHKDDSLVIVNNGDTAFFIPPLNLKEEKEENKSIQGAAWGVDILQPGECVIAVKDTGNPKLPDLVCKEVGERLVVGRGDRLWDKDFDVYYGITKIDTCDKDDDNCEVVYGDGND